jgi:hypothetical protein
MHIKTAMLFTSRYGRGSVILVFARLGGRSPLFTLLPRRVVFPETRIKPVTSLSNRTGPMRNLAPLA